MSEIATITYDGNTVTFADGTMWSIGETVPCGMGSLELRHTKRAGLHIVRLSGSGGFSYSVRLRQSGEYRFGPSYGHRVKTPAEEKDPIRRVLRELDLGVKILMRETAESIFVSEHYADLFRAYPEGSTAWRWFTDGDLSRVSEEQSWRSQHAQEIDRMVEITGATYAVRIEDRVMRGFNNVQTRIVEILVWEDCDPAVLRNALKGVQATISS